MKRPRSGRPDRHWRLVEAACEGDANLARFLADHPGAASYRCTGVGETAMHYLLIENRVDATERLRRQGLEIDAPDRMGNHPVASCAGIGQNEALAWLLKHGADPNGTDSCGDPALHCAARADQTRAEKVLLDAGADTSYVTSLGDTYVAELAARAESPRRQRKARERSAAP